MYFVFDMSRYLQKPKETSKESKEPGPRDHMTVSQMGLRTREYPTVLAGALPRVPQLDAGPDATPSEPPPIATEVPPTPASPRWSAVPHDTRPPTHGSTVTCSVGLGVRVGVGAVVTMGMVLAAVSVVLVVTAGMVVVVTVVLWYPWVSVVL